MSTAFVGNPIRALRWGLPFRFSRLEPNGQPAGHCVYLLPGHAERFAVMHAVSLIEQMEALEIRAEMGREERQRQAREVRQQEQERSKRDLLLIIQKAHIQALLRSRQGTSQSRARYAEEAQRHARAYAIYATPSGTQEIAA